MTASVRRRAHVVLIGIVGIAATLRLYKLEQNGYGREYFAAGVRSMLESFHCFLYNAFDPAGFVSLDKPPLALWLQVASAKVLGFSAFSVLLPQVLEGLVSVVLVYKLVARRFGAGAALLGAAFLALTPISVAIDRSNNTDSCLTLVLLLAAWALIRAAESGSFRLLVLAMALVGVGFNVKMAAALGIVPTFVLVYGCSPQAASPARRAARLGIALVVMSVVALSWVSLFDLTPAAERPYAGSTKHNAMLELALLHNGLERFIAAPSGEVAPAAPAASAAQQSVPSPAGGQAAVVRSLPAAALWDQTPVGPLRLATPHLAAQMGWWLPLAIAGVALGLGAWPWRRPLSARQINVAVWAGWALTYGIVFSFAGGVFHTYYVSVLAPPLAALAGIGLAVLWRAWRAGRWPLGLPLVLLAVAAWQLRIGHDYVEWQVGDWRSVLLVASILGLVLVSAFMWRRPRRALGPAPASALALALLALLATPLAWALSTVLVRPNVAAPAANIAMLVDTSAEPTAHAASADSRPRARRLLEFLAAQHRTERFLLAVPNAMQASPLIVRTGAPIMSMGGYLGRDPILTPADLERMVAGGELRFVILGGYAIVPADTRGERALAAWIRVHGRRVDAALWREPVDASRPAPERRPWPSSPARLYDLHPDEALTAD